MQSNDETIHNSSFQILALTQGEWGERIAKHVQASAPPHWEVEIWSAPRILPPIIDDPEDFIPESLPSATLILSLGDTSGLAQLIPDIAQVTGAKAVLAPIDNNASLPPGLALQLNKWLEDIGVSSVFPKPFCSLTETTINVKPLLVEYDSPEVAEFARYFGKPQFNITVEDGSASGSAISLIGTPVDEAVERTGMLHHHFPCLASMSQDSDYLDTLMHVSGHILQDAVKDEIKEFISPTPYLRPSGRLEDTPEIEAGSGVVDG
jgi:hypothetical protein